MKFLTLVGRTAAPACSSGSAPAGSPGPSASTSARTAATITVTEKEYSMALSQAQAAAGTVTFVLDNASALAHALAVSGSGVSEALPPGGTARLTVTLRPGSYELWCPVDKHKKLGMDTHLQVGGSGPASPAPGSAAASAAGQ
ncbi:cupredoxin domain-containing protein [Streptomyces sp. NPDC004728]|uniref:cupredoxin domain-containing protein n=1 Tax=Streptomyces sp. NPDC004728 TaxID=3154289 RepID=UPI0033BBAF29